MFESLLQTIGQAYSGDQAKRHVAAISQYHRIQASPGYREAARYVRAQLHAAGLSTELLSFPADKHTSFWTMRSFQEWACARATLDVVRGDPGHVVERLCDFQAEPISLIQRSASCDGVYDVVVVQDGTLDVHYSGLDVAGKLVLTDGDVSRVYDLAVKRRGAAGILFDGMSSNAPGRNPQDLPDARQYTSFWWTPDDPKCFGFVLTPSQGRNLRHEMPVHVRAHVVSTFYDGAFEVVTAFIPGQTDAEVVVVSHLCHPQPSANDNASGAAANIEIAATLRKLINTGKLAPPRAGIRFLWVPEMTGTYAYLSTYPERLPHMIAGVNLDMVGQNQARCHSTFNIERPPEAMASFAPVLMKQLWDLMQGVGPDDEAERNPSPIHHAVTPFSGGSDHYILSDPTVGVPTPMLIQWPDRFYHTSEDTLDKVDPAMLARIGTLAASYAYAVASAGEREATWLGQAIVTRRARRLARRAQDAITAALVSNDLAELSRIAAELAAAVDHRVERDKAALGTLLRLWPGAAPLVAELSQWIDEAAQRELGRAKSVFRSQTEALGGTELPDPPPDALESAWLPLASQLTPRRLYRGPIGFRSLLDDMDLAEQDALWELGHQIGRDWHTIHSLAEYWADGQRTVAEIADRVRLETGKSHGAAILAFFQALAKHGLVEWRETHETGEVP